MHSILKRSIPCYASLLFLAAALPAAAAQSWTTTETRAFPLLAAEAARVLPESQPIRITVALKLRDADAVDAYLQRTLTPGDALYRQTLSRGEFTERYAATRAQANAVVDYLSRMGFSQVEVASNRLLVRAVGTPSAVHRAFNTSLAPVDVGGRQAWANVGDARVPAALGNTVLAVLGLQTVDIAHTALQAADVKPDAVVAGFSPLEFPALYNAVQIPTASTQQVAISTWGDMTPALSDLAIFEAQNALPATNVSVVATGTAGTDTSGTVEWDLDTQTILGMSGGVAGLVLYAAPSASNSDLLDAINTFVTDASAYSLNGSWGECETAARISGFMAALDTVFRQAVAQGQTAFFSSGDEGSRIGCVASKSLLPQVSYPASSRYVTAVGGTTLKTTGTPAGYSSETAWSGSGGGYSSYERPQAWQLPYSSKQYLRGVPDVAMDADPSSGARIIYKGQLQTYGGTSLAAPLVTAVWSRLAAAFGPPGFAAPQLYFLAGVTGLPAVPYHDVTSGSNGKYSAVIGWDPVTGLGSINVDAFYLDVLSFSTP